MADNLKRVLILDFDGVIVELNLPQDYAKALLPSRFGAFTSRFVATVENYFRTRLTWPARLVVEFRSVMKASPAADVKPFLDRFNGRVYLASMQTGPVLEFFVHRHGLRKYFVEVLSSDGFKRKADQVRYVMTKEGAAEYLLVDDSEGNVESLAKLGVHTILLKRRRGETLFKVLDLTERFKRESSL